MASRAYAADPPLALTLTLKEAIRMGVERNLDVRAELYNPAQFEADINRNRSIYDPLFSAQTSYSDANTASAGTVALGTNSQQSFELNASLSRLFWTGGTAALSFNNAYLKNSFNGTGVFSASTTGLSNYWQSSLGVTLTQPLLKNLGRENTEVNIDVSRLSKYASIERFSDRLLATVARVRSEYYRLYSLREELEVRKVSLELARKVLAETKARVAAGVLPAMEILNAEFGVTSREKDMIDAEKAVSDQVDVLRLLLQIEGRGDILTADPPRRDPFEVNETEALKRAMSRPDIREQKRNLEIAELQTRVFGNRTKPDLSLTASTSLTGMDRDYPGDLNKVVSFDTPVWSIGLNLSYSLGNSAAENDYRRSRLKTEQTALQIRSLEESAANEVKSAIRGVISGYKQIDVADRGRAFADERLRAFIRRNEVGLATTRDVMDVENDLVSAKNNQIIAVVNYDNAVTRLWQVTGELLEREGVRMVEGDADKLYTNIR
ncbi:MAG: TolC family protein [Deltaproteobacteria bacterium]|nr:TolC family protein [Deltaproteobacteria bacterium]